MPIQIEDSRGSGRSAAVDAEYRLTTAAVTQPQKQNINFKDSKVWSIPFEGLNPAGNDDYVVYIKNDGDNDLSISDIRVMCDTAASQLELHAVSGTATGGTTITLVSRTVGSSITPTATIESGTDILGLTSDGIIFFIQCDTVNVEYHLETKSSVRIPKGKAVALLVETGTANVTGVITLVEHS